MLDTCPAIARALVCGDFNTRVGAACPRVRNEANARVSLDTFTCARAQWFVQMCEQRELNILNGLKPGEPA